MPDVRKWLETLLKNRSAPAGSEWAIPRARPRVDAMGLEFELPNWRDALPQQGKKPFRAPAAQVFGQIVEVPGDATTHWDVLDKAIKELGGEQVRRADKAGKFKFGFTTQRGEFMPHERVPEHFPNVLPESTNLRKAGLLTLLGSAGTGFLQGAGLPTPADIRAAESAAQTSGTRPMGELLQRMFGQLLEEGGGRQMLSALMERLQHPVETGRELLAAARADPARAVGFGTGMAASMIPLNRLRIVPPAYTTIGKVERAQRAYQLKFGGRALTDAERRVERRVAKERARVHAELEGPATRGLDVPEGGISQIDLIRDMPDRSLIAAQKFSRVQPGYEQHTKMLEAEMGRRGLKPDISEEISMMEEGPRAPLTEGPMARRPPTGREQVYGEFQTDVPPERIGRSEKLPMPPVFTREERGAEMLKGVPLRQETSSAQQIAQILHSGEQVSGIPSPRPQPVGTQLAFMGRRWVLTKRGWTSLEQNAGLNQRDYDWIFERTFDRRPAPPPMPGETLASESGGLEMLDRAAAARAEEAANLWESPVRESNIKQAISMVQRHGSFSEKSARMIVEHHILARMQAGKATPQEIVWYNVQQAGGFEPGKFTW